MDVKRWWNPSEYIYGVERGWMDEVEKRCQIEFNESDCTHLYTCAGFKSIMGRVLI